MKIAVIGASGRSGKLIAQEAISRSLDTTAIVRDHTKVHGMPVLEKDILSLTKTDLTVFDVVICAFGIWDESQFAQFMTTTKHLCDLLANTNTRLLIVGGAGSLYINPEHTMQAYQTKEFPAEYLPLAMAMAKQLDYIRTRQDVKWTYLSPAAIFDTDGKRTDKFITGGEEAIVNTKGESYISYADYAIAMIDEVVKPKHIGQRFSVIAE